MRTMNFVQVSTSTLAKANKAWDTLSIPCGMYAFVQCDKTGKHQPFDKIKRIWFPLDVIQRFSEGKPTKVFFKEV